MQPAPSRPAPPRLCAACISHVRVVGMPLTDFMLQPATCRGQGQVAGSAAAATGAAAVAPATASPGLVVVHPDPLTLAGGLRDRGSDAEDDEYSTEGEGEDGGGDDYGYGFDEEDDEEEWDSGSEGGGDDSWGALPGPPPPPGAAAEAGAAADGEGTSSQHPAREGLS